MVDATHLARPRRSLRVLVADDAALIRMLMAEMLSRAGYSVNVAERRLDAVTANGNERFDIILMDMQMPVMDGIDAMQDMRAQEDPRGRIPTIALTADALQTNHKNYMDGGASLALTKPVKWENLLAEMERLTERVRALTQ